MSIGQRIKLFRQKANISQEELAVKVGISRISMSNYERGERIPPVDVFLRIAKALHISMDELLEYDPKQDELTKCINTCRNAGLIIDPFHVQALNNGVVGVYQNQEAFEQARTKGTPIPANIPVLTEAGFITAVKEGMNNPNYQAAQKDLLKMYLYASILREYAKEDGFVNIDIETLKQGHLPLKVKEKIVKNQNANKEFFDKLFECIHKNQNLTKETIQELAKQLHELEQEYQK